MSSDYIIGIGSQRAGSTLLHRILKTNKQIFMHPVKELHYFDTLNSIRNEKVLKKYSKSQIDRELKIIYESDKRVDNNKEYRCYLRTNHILYNNNISNVVYRDLFRPCVMGNKYLGEITPEYMLLRGTQIQEMARVLGSDAKIILIGRNPIDRYISSCKLSKMYMNENSQINRDEFISYVRDTTVAKGDWFEQQSQLSNYNLALSEFQKYFNNVLALDYNQLFTNANNLSCYLSEFLDIEFDVEEVEKIISGKVNSLGETFTLDDDLLSYLNIELKDQILEYSDYLTKVIK